MSAYPAPRFSPTLPPSDPPHPSPLPSFWTHNFSSDLTDLNNSGSLPSRADVVIIGSGITGSSAAAKLVNDLIVKGEVAGETRIVVLEARQFCSGATGRNGGHLTPLPRLEFATLVEACGGVEDAKKSVLLEDKAIANVVGQCEKYGWEQDVDLRFNGCVHLFFTEEAEVAQRKELEAAELAGVDVSSVTWLSSSEIHTRYRATARSAVLIPGHTIYPLKYVTKLFSHAQKLAKDSPVVSLELYTNVLVESVTPSDKGDQWTVNTSRGGIHANQILHATNGYATYILPHLARTRNQIIPTRGQVISIVPPLPTTNPAPPSFSTLTEYLFQRDGPRGEIIVGGARLFAGAPYEGGISDDSSINPSIGAELRRCLKPVFDWKEDGEVGMEWTGIMGYKENGHPLMGQVYSNGKALPGQWICAGYTGHGMARAPACAEAVADMMLAEKFGETFLTPEWLPSVYIVPKEGWDDSDGTEDWEKVGPSDQPPAVPPKRNWLACTIA